MREQASPAINLLDNQQLNAVLLLKLLNWSWKSAFPSHLESSFTFTLMPYKVKITKILLLSKYLWVLNECIIQDQWFKSMLVSSQTENSLVNWSISFFSPCSIFSVQNGSAIKWVLHGHRILALTAISSYIFSMYVRQNYWSTHLTFTIKAHISQNSCTLLDEGERKSTDRRKKEMKKSVTYFNLHALIDRGDRIKRRSEKFITRAPHSM